VTAPSSGESATNRSGIGLDYRQPSRLAGRAEPLAANAARRAREVQGSKSWSLVLGLNPFPSSAEPGANLTFCGCEDARHQG
jgi:hypothetical protein